MGNDNKVAVEVIRTFRLLLKTFIWIWLRIMLHCLLDEIQFLFRFWTNPIILIHLEIIKLISRDSSDVGYGPLIDIECSYKEMLQRIRTV